MEEVMAAIEQALKHCPAGARVFLRRGTDWPRDFSQLSHLIGNMD